ncbi:RIP metalloprotease RseP [Aquabacterium soli]|uniref:Zinc metalloprotease n=1 Tax=Aquabacterium soli TaxID=2493092 RepID=A0A3R8S126_9BURK|nr:RIP metalloprotease RseP [Aquabacterium soli]RRS03594.1 RIP metalloprotease RseP [Aquabacterium soli]
MLTTVLAFLVTIGVLVVIHEYGHYRAAVACNVKVLRFSVGFGRVLWRRQRGETEFVISALPLGGYVKMLDEREAPVHVADQARAFNRKPLWQRAFIVAAGPAANLALAVLLYAVVNWAGVQELKARLAAPVPASIAANAGMQSGDEVLALAPSGGDVPQASDWLPVRSMNDLQWHLTNAVLQSGDLRLQVRRMGQGGAPGETVELLLGTAKLSAADVDPKLMDRLGFSGPYASAEIRRVIEGGPAEAAGLKAGDKVLSLDGREPRDAGQLRQWISQSARDGVARPLAVVVSRQGQSVELSVTPVIKTEGDQRVPRIVAEIGSPVEMVMVNYGALEGFTKAAQRTWDVSTLTLDMLGKMVIGQASLKNLSGPLTIADYAGRSAELGWAYYLGFLAMVSVSLGVLNLLPLPMLDGGHLMYYLFEGVTGRPVSDAWLERLQRGGVAVMFLMMSLALYNDFARLLGMH